MTGKQLVLSDYPKKKGRSSGFGSQPVKKSDQKPPLYGQLMLEYLTRSPKEREGTFSAHGAGPVLVGDVDKTAFRFVMKVSPLFDSDFGAYQWPRATVGFRSYNHKAVKPSC